MINEYNLNTEPSSVIQSCLCVNGSNLYERYPFNGSNLYERLQVRREGAGEWAAFVFYLFIYFMRV